MRLLAKAVMQDVEKPGPASGSLSEAAVDHCEGRPPVRQIVAEGPGLGLTEAAERWGEKITWPEQLQGRSVGEGRLLENNAVHDQEVEYVAGNRGEYVGEIFVASGQYRRDQRALGVWAILTRNGPRDLRERSREADRRRPWGPLGLARTRLTATDVPHDLLPRNQRWYSSSAKAASQGIRATSEPGNG
jgi:hypothetical protein